MDFLIWLDSALPALFAALFGAVFASFCCVVVERVPKGVSINGHSMCVCGRPLKAYENVPVFGWLLSGGKARCCGARIPAHYFWAELISAAGWSLLVLTLGPLLGFTISAVLTGIVTTLLTLHKKKLNNLHA